MKNTFKHYLFIGFMFFSACSLFAQTSPKDSDLLARAALASEYIEEAKVYYDSPKGEACANLILKMYRAQEPIPVISLTNLNSADQERVTKLIAKLSSLRNNPPSWIELLNFETKRLIDEDKAYRKKSKYKE